MIACWGHQIMIPMILHGWRSIIELSLSPFHCISWTSHLSFCIFLAMTLFADCAIKENLAGSVFKVWMFCCYRLGDRGWDGWMASLSQCCLKETTTLSRVNRFSLFFWRRFWPDTVLTFVRSLCENFSFVQGSSRETLCTTHHSWLDWGIWPNSGEKAIREAWNKISALTVRPSSNPLTLS